MGVPAWVCWALGAGRVAGRWKWQQWPFFPRIFSLHSIFARILGQESHNSTVLTDVDIHVGIRSINFPPIPRTKSMPNF